MDDLWIIVMFLSAVRTLILMAPIHCNGYFGEQVMECYISSNKEKKTLIYILSGLRVNQFSAFFSFWVQIVLVYLNTTINRRM